MQAGINRLLTAKGSPGPWVRQATAVGLTLAMLALYHANGDFLPGNDATANLYLPVNLLRGRGLSFRPEEMPQMFIWHLCPPAGYQAKPADPSGAKLPQNPTQPVSRRTVRIAAWQRPIDPKSWQWLQKVHHPPWAEPPTWRQLWQTGWLRLAGPEYYLVPSKEPDRLGYVNQYGPGAGLSALPIFAILDFWTGSLEDRPALLWYGGKWVASLCVALSVSLVYLTLCRMTSPLAALLIAFLYGTATCVWSVSSQTLWQSGPNVLFLALAVYCLVQADRSRPIGRAWLWMAAAGLSAGWAVVCRPTSALVVLAVAGALLLRAIRMGQIRRSRRSWGLAEQSVAASAGRETAPTAPGGQPGGSKPLTSGEQPGWSTAVASGGQPTWRQAAARWGTVLSFLLGTLPPAAFLAVYNTYYLGAPWRFGQVEVGRRLAQDQLGTADAWSGDFLEGLYGQLISPARGLLVYSPILAFAIWGMTLAWRRRRYRVLRPLTVAALLLLLVQSKWFNWHGGWSFGYRLMVDTMPLAAVCAAPTVPWIRRWWGLGILAAVLAAWSVGVQILGAFAYDVVGWNCREGVVVRLPDGRAVPVQTKEEAVALVRQTGGAVQTVLMDVDQRPWRRRLWSIQDNPIRYYLENFRQSRQRKHHLMQSVLEPP